MPEPRINDIREALHRVHPAIRKTPVLTCETLNRHCSAQLFFKCENFQKTGSFKMRGAANAVFSLPQDSASKGVATHSSGNHAAALALAARLRGVKAYVIMPASAPEIKKEAVASYGAEITFCESTMEAREEGLARMVKHTGAAIIHPFNDYRIMAGQGTAALELCETVGDLDAVLAPVGGGGLLSGTAIAVSAMCPQTKIFGAEPEKADDAARSLKAGRIVPGDYPATIADGLRTTVGTLTFPVIKKLVTDIVTVPEEAIMEALRMVWERMKIIIEPSAAVPLAALLIHRSIVPGKKIGVILSGGNIDVRHLIR